MRFLNPSMFFLASTLPVVVIFYMLKIRRKDAPISSIYLWQDLLQDIQANTPWQRLKPNLLMFLQLLILAILIASLASPAVSKTAGSAKNIILIIDTSQSMGTLDPGTSKEASRLSVAKAKAREIIDRAPGDARVSLITAADRTRAILINSQDMGQVRRKIDELTPEGSSTNIANAITLGSSIANRAKDSNVYVISDGGFENIGTTLQSHITFIGVGQSDDNVAIRTASLLENPNPPHMPQLFISVKNFSEGKKDTLVSIYSNNKLIDSKRLELKGRSADSIIFRDGLSGLEAAEIRLQCDDSLKVDNRAWVLRPRRSFKNIALVSNGNMFLEEGLRAVSPAKISLINPKEWSGAKGTAISKSADFLIFDGFVPGKLPNRNLLVVNPPVVKGKPSIFEASGFARVPSVEVLDPNHPILRLVDLSEVRIARLKATLVPSWMRTIAGGKSGNTLATAIAAGEDAGRRVVLLSFDLGDSDLPLRIAYPILLANIIDYISPASAGKNPSQLNIGETLAIRPNASAKSITIDCPDGHRKELGKEERFFQDTQVPGIYRIKQAIGSRVVSEVFAVSLISQRESDIAPSDHPELALEQSSKNGRSGGKTDTEIWQWPALIALLLLFVEGWVYLKGY